MPGGEQAEHRAREGRLARAGFADQADDLAAADVERTSRDELDVALLSDCSSIVSPRTSRMFAGSNGR